MRTSTLAAILTRDLLCTEPTRRSDAVECFACGRPFMPRPSIGDDNSHAFCSTHCRDLASNNDLDEGDRWKTTAAFVPGS